MIIRHLLLGTSLLLSLSFCEAGFGVDKCQDRADIALLVDSSTRMNKENSDLVEKGIKRTIKDIIQSLDFAPPSYMRLALMLFGGDDPEVIFDFDRYIDEASYIAAVDSMASRKYTQSLTGVAVRKAKTSLFDTASQRNDKPAKLLVLITAGEASDGTEADAAIDEVKADGINVFPVGIGDSFSDDTLRRWKTKGSFKVSFTEVKYGGHRIDALRQQICEDIRIANLLVSNVCPDKYTGAYYCWPFGSIDQWRNTLDSNQHRKGRLNWEAQITKTESHGTVLDLTHARAAVDLGEYRGECISDPDQCRQGLTVMFDIKITQEMIDRNLQEGYTHQYIISTGGQRKDSRGFAFLYQKDDSNTGFKLQLQTSTADYVVPIPKVPDTWFTATFTFKGGKCDLTTVTTKNVTCCYGLAKVRQKSCIESVGVNTGLYYYQDGQFVKKGAKTIGTFPNDAQTSVTIGRPNSKRDQYASFEMKNLVIWYSLLSPNDIERIATGRAQGPENDHEQAEPDEVKCKGRSDVVLLVDSSTNMSPEYFDVAKHTIKGIIKKYDYAAPESVRLALMLFGGAEPEMIFDFDTYTNEADYIAAVDSMALRKYTQSLTGVAIRKAKERLDDAVTHRVDHPGKLVILITAGEPSDREDADAAVKEVDKDGILFPIGVGDAGIDVARGWKWDMFYFGSMDKDKNPSFLKMITDNLCQAARDAAEYAEAAHETAEKARIFAEKAAQSKCPARYNGAYYCWPFSLSSLWGAKTIEAIKHKTGTLHNGAQIREGEGSFLDLLTAGASADLGDYEGECLSDPEQCTEGLTVMFDMKISPNSIRYSAWSGNPEQYIISTGGQERKTRGFAFRYTSEESGFILQLKTSEVQYSLYYKGEGDIPEDWFTVAFTFKKNEKRYFIPSNSGKKTWQEAKETCMEFGGDLATISSNEEAEKVKSIMSLKEPYWIGYHKQRQDNKDVWVWSDGSSSSYTNWDIGEPNLHETEKCAEIKKNGKWNNLKCGGSIKFICQDKDYGLSFYENGQLRKKEEEGKTGKFKRDHWTHMTIGRPNHEEQSAQDQAQEQTQEHPQESAQGQAQEQAQEHPQESAQDQAQEQSQEHPQESAQGQAQEQAQEHPQESAQDQAQEQSQEHPQESAQGQAQEQAQEHPQESAQNQAQEQSQEHPQESAQGQAQEQAQEHPQESAQDQAQEQSQEHPQESAQGQAQEQAQEHPQESAQDQAQEQTQEHPQESAQDQAQEQAQEHPQESAQNQAQEQSQEHPQESAQNQAQEQSQEHPQESAQGQAQEQAQEHPQESAQDQAQEQTQEHPQESAQDQAQEQTQEHPQESTQDQAQEQTQEHPQESAQDQAQEQTQEHPHEEERPQEQAQEESQPQSQDLPSGFSAKDSCGKGYQNAKYCYPFDNVIDNSGVAISPEVVAHLKNAVLKDGAVIADSPKRGKVLSLTENRMSWATIGDFAGECASDPSLCANGISVSFWIRLKQASVSRRNDLNHAKQFIISTGGHTGRGFAMFYFKPESKYSLELKTDNTVFAATFSHVTDDWFHFAFKYKEGTGLVFYINGKEKGRNDGAPSISDSNTQTFLTIGRPDATSAATTTYGSFRLDHLVLFYKEITKEELDVIVPPKENPTPDAQHEDSTATCGTGYEEARFCWPFDSASTTALGTITQEIITRTKNAELKDGAVIADSSKRGKVLSLEQQGSWVNAGDFQDECTSDVSLCTEGISVMFWLRIRSSDIETNGANHQYIISSGGQVDSARGFSFLYSKEDSNFKLQIQTTANVYITEFASLPDDWFHFAFTFKKGNGLFYYINEQKTGPVAAQAGSHITDTYTKLTIGKPNHADRMHGTFRMDHLVIFYKQVTQEGINTILQVPAATTKAPVATQAATTKAPVATQAATTQAPVTVIPAQTKAPTVVGGKCTARIDVVIVLDNSGSIEARNHDGFFSKMKTFAKHVYHSFQVGSVADVAFVESGTSPRIIFNFGRYKNVSNMDSAVNNIKYKKQRSFIGKALELVRTDVISNVACKKSTKVVIVITDGYSSDDVTLPSELLRNSEVTVVSVGFGEETPYMKYALQTMASDPKDQFSFIFDYGVIMEGISKVVAVACQAANVAESPFALDHGAPQGGVSASFKAKLLEEANKFRRMHSAVPLVWSDKLATKAQIWAEKLAREQQTKHLPTSSLGQAIFVSTVPLSSPAISSVRAWYNQILFYDFQRPKINSMNRYFVHLVWRASVDVGVGLAVSSTTPKQTYIVAFFDPAEDLEENVKYNVLPVTGSAVVGIKPGSCPEGFQSEADYCYKLFTEGKSWVKAVKACNDMKASLVSVTDQDEHSFLTQMLSKSTILRSWIGLNDRLREGAFSWVDGMPLSFHGWQSAPQNGSKKDCVEYDTEKGWVNNNCEVIRPYVCKALKPGDIMFVVTLHYPTEPWSSDLVHGSSDAAVNIIQRVDKLIKDVYNGKDWFLSYKIKAFRGHVSVMIDIEMRFAPGAPIDPLAPLKKVVFSEDCEGYLCDIPDIQLVPAMNVTYNSTQCQPSCYVSCSASCEPVCCSPDNSQSFYGYEIISFPATSPPPPPPPSPLPSPVYVQSQHIQPSAYQSAYSSYCPQVCSQQCLPTCPRVCCTQVNVMAQFSRRRGK